MNDAKICTATCQHIVVNVGGPLNMASHLLVLSLRTTDAAYNSLFKASRTTSYVVPTFCETICIRIVLQFRVIHVRMWHKLRWPQLRLEKVGASSLHAL